MSPYDQLALLSAQGGSWEETLKYSKTVIELNPVEFPSAFWYNAIANYNLKNTAEAEKSAKALLKVDTRHRYPQAESMLAQFAAKRGEYAEAATHCALGQRREAIFPYNAHPGELRRSPFNQRNADYTAKWISKRRAIARDRYCFLHGA